MKQLLLLIFAAALLTSGTPSGKGKTYKPYVALEFNLGVPVKFIKIAPVDIGKGEKGFAILFSEENDIDPYEGSFFFPRSTPKLAVVTDEGVELWRRELPYSIPGTWFMPMLPLDMDGDGLDEIYYVVNTGRLPFNYDTYKMERADSRTGKVTGSWDWPSPTHNQANSYKWRFFLIGGYVAGEPVLVTTQGTYRDMSLQCWNTDMTKRWERYYPDDFNGSRGSHSTPVLDMDRSGIYQFMYGERCISFDDGKELFVLDKDVWGDHSDTVLPFYDEKKNTWNFFTTREKGDDGKFSRSVTFNRDGKHLWEIDEKKGHYHYGWVGNFGLDGERIAMAGRYPFKDEPYPEKTCIGKTYHAFTGEEIAVKVPMTGTVLDFNGDGIHEMFSKNVLYDHLGNEVLTFDEKVSVVGAKKVLNLPGEQLMVALPDGRVQIWADGNARESKMMQKRFSDPVYVINLKGSAVGYNSRFPILNY